MASNVSTVDGLGFEEVNQSTSTDLISGTNIYGTNGYFGTVNSTLLSGTTVIGNIISGTTIRVGAEGILHSIQVGSPSAYNAMLKAGSIITSAGSSGFVNFGTNFSTTGYYVSITPTGSVTGYNQSYISGVRHVSGINIVGGPSLRYDWIAVGI